jgi:hypothetical protein
MIAAQMIAEAARLKGRAAGHRHEGRGFTAARLDTAAANLLHTARQLHTIAALERDTITTGGIEI